MNLDQFKHSVALDALSMTSVLTPLLHHYRAGLDQSVLANRVNLEMSVVHQGNAEDAWTAVPADGEPGFMKVAVRVSVQLQKTLRCWLQMHWFADVENLSDTTKSPQLLAYLACKPFVPKYKNAYAYDLLDDWSTNMIDRSIRSDMPDALARASNPLRILGRHDLADFYDPSHASWFVTEIERNGKMFYDLLAREARIIHAWVPLIGKKPTQKQLDEARRETSIALNEIFRRGEDLSYLAPLFEMEVVAAIETYIGKPVSRQLSLTGNPEQMPSGAALQDPERVANVIPFPVSRPMEHKKRRLIPYPLLDVDRAA